MSLPVVRGVYLWDSEGQRLLDGMAGLWCCQLGYGNEELAQAGYQALKDLAFYNTFFQTTHPYVVDLSEKLASLTPEGIDTFFFANSGSEANDTAVKFIRYYWNLQNKPNKKIILSRELAYHGSTNMAASLTGLKYMHPQFDLPLPGVEHVGPPPHWYKFGGEMSPDDFGLHVAEATEQAILRLGPENVAAFIGEPVMGAGGLMVPPDTYWSAVQEVCRKYDVLIWADEVITGFGRTANWFGSETYGIEPDVLTMAKGLTSGYQPLSAVGMGPRLGDAMKTANEEFAMALPIRAIRCARLWRCAIWNCWKSWMLQARRARKKLRISKTRFARLPTILWWGKCAVWACLGELKLVKGKKTRTFYPPEKDVGYICREFCFNNGLIMRASGDTMLLSPPLIINEVQIDELVEKARHCFDLTLEAIS